MASATETASPDYSDMVYVHCTKCNSTSVKHKKDEWTDWKRNKTKNIYTGNCSKIRCRSTDTQHILRWQCIIIFQNSFQAFLIFIEWMQGITTRKKIIKIMRDYCGFNVLHRHEILWRLLWFWMIILVW